MLRDFLSYRKLRSLYDKNAPQGSHSREVVDCRERPRSARECARAHSLVVNKMDLRK